MTIGFAKIMDREFRQSLDRELAVQANYAAESGMNDARNYIASGVDVDTAGNCLNTDSLSAAQQPYFTNKGGMSDGQVLDKYTCVSIDTNVHDIELKIPRGQSKIVKIITPDTLDKLYFSWNNQDAGAQTGSTGLPNLNQYPQESYWSTAANKNATGVLRTTVYPVPGDGSAQTAGDKNTDLESLSRNYFMYPNTGSGIPGPISFNLNDGVPVPGNCNQNNYTTAQGSLPFKTKYFCNSVITNMAPAAPPPPASPLTLLGNAHSSCTPIVPPATGAWPCTDTATGGVFSFQEFTSTYSLAGLAPGNYQLTLRYSNFNSPGWNPPSCGTYNYNVNVKINGLAQVNNWQLNTCTSVATVNVNIPSAGSNLTFEWTNNLFVPCAPGPLCDPNFQIDSITLTPPPPVVVNNAGNAYYYVKLTALYRDLSVSIQGANAAGTSLPLKKAQAIIDVTAKGNDVLKRLQGRLSLEPDYDYPQFAVDSMDTLCKRLRLPKTGPNTYGNAAYQDLAAGDAFVNFACSAGSIGGSNVPAM
jgi:hypothetical protein